MGLECFGRGAGDKYHITEHQVRASNWARGGASGVEARESSRWSLTGDKDPERDQYALWRGARHMGYGYVEQILGGIRGGMDIGNVVAGGGHCQLRTKCGKFLVDIRFVDVILRQFIRSPKRPAQWLLRGTGIGGSYEGVWGL